MKHSKRVLLCLAALLLLPACGQAKAPADTGEVSLLYLDGYVYYTFGGSLYKESSDFTQQNCLATGGAASVFYSYGRVGYVDGGGNNALTVMMSSGDNREVLLEDAAMPVAMKDAIYAIAGKERRIIRIGNDGASTELNAKNCVSFDIAEDAMYFSTENGLYRLELNEGAAPKRLRGGRNITHVFAGARLQEDGAAPVEATEVVYFVQEGLLYTIAATGGKAERVSGIKSDSWCVLAEEAYCIVNNQLTRLTLREGAAMLLTDDCAAIAGVADGWVYFVSEADGAQQFERMKLDGSKRREVLVEAITG